MADYDNTAFIDIDSLTTGEVSGTGVFDELMNAAKAHLAEEYKRGRITGDQYTKVYTATIQSAMAQATQYTLSYLTTNRQLKLLDQQILNELANNQVILNQAAKTESEKAVLDQKLITEQAQTIGSSDTVAGIVGRQMKLFDNQAEGYLRDAEQKAAKIFMDSYNTRSSIEVTEATEDTDATVTGAQIKDVLNKVRAGVGVDEIT